MTMYEIQQTKTWGIGLYATCAIAIWLLLSSGIGWHKVENPYILGFTIVSALGFGLYLTGIIDGIISAYLRYESDKEWDAITASTKRRIEEREH